MKNLYEKFLPGQTLFTIIPLLVSSKSNDFCCNLVKAVNAILDLFEKVEIPLIKFFLYLKAKAIYMLYACDGLRRG